MIALKEPIPIPGEVEAFDFQKAMCQFRIVAIGDSITACGNMERRQRWTGILEASLGPDVRVVNAGIGGTSSSLGLYRWERDVTPIQPHCVVICFLLNDSHIRHYECSASYVVQCTPDRMEANMRTMFERIRAMGAVPVLWTPPPVPGWPDNRKSQTHLEIQLQLCEQYAGILERSAQEMEVALSHFWRTFPLLVEEYPGKYFERPDDYHSTLHAQPILAHGIGKLVRSVYETWKQQGRG